MKCLILLLFCSMLICGCCALQNMLQGEFYEWAKCLCHSVSGCWRRQNCATYSINKEYWRTAGSPRLIQSDDPNSDASYTNCMKNENCIVNTLKLYTDKFLSDCNCDGKRDLKDLLAIHLNMQTKGTCVNPQFNRTTMNRYNRCAVNLQLPSMRENEAHCPV